MITALRTYGKFWRSICSTKTQNLIPNVVLVHITCIKQEGLANNSLPATFVVKQNNAPKITRNLVIGSPMLQKLWLYPSSQHRDVSYLQICTVYILKVYEISTKDHKNSVASITSHNKNGYHQTQSTRSTDSDHCAQKFLRRQFARVFFRENIVPVAALLSHLVEKAGTSDVVLYFVFMPYAFLC